MLTETHYIHESDFDGSDPEHLVKYAADRAPKELVAWMRQIGWDYDIESSGIAGWAFTRPFKVGEATPFYNQDHVPMSNLVDFMRNAARGNSWEITVGDTTIKSNPPRGAE